MSASINGNSTLPMPFWKRRIQRAWRDTLDDLSLKQGRRSVIKIVVIAVAVLILWLIGLVEIAQERVWEIISFIAAIAAVFVALFVYNWIAAAGRIAADDANRIAELESAAALQRNRDEIISAIGKCIAELQPLYRNVTTEEEYNRWREDRKARQLVIYTTLDNYFSEPEIEAILTIAPQSIVPPQRTDWRGAFSMHLQQIRGVEAKLLDMAHSYRLQNVR